MIHIDVDVINYQIAEARREGHREGMEHGAFLGAAAMFALWLVVTLAFRFTQSPPADTPAPPDNASPRRPTSRAP